MPIDILPISVRAEHCSNTKRSTCDAEIKSGFLVLLGPSLRQHVKVIVYRTSLEHFAVIYPRRRLSRAVGVVNLRNSITDRIETGFVVRQKGYDNTVSAKFLCTEHEVESWLSAFKSCSPPACQQCILPVVIEAEEN